MVFCSIYSIPVFCISFMASVIITFFSIFSADGTRDNDWKCPKCGNVNFSFRTVCNMRKCNTPKPGSQVWLAVMFQDLYLIIYDIVSFLVSTTNFELFWMKFRLSWTKNVICYQEFCMCYVCIRWSDFEIQVDFLFFLLISTLEVVSQLHFDFLLTIFICNTGFQIGEEY